MIEALHLGGGGVKGGQPDSLSEIEFRTSYVVAERLIVAPMLRFKPAKNVLSDTLSGCPPPRAGGAGHYLGVLARNVAAGSAIA